MAVQAAAGHPQYSGNFVPEIWSGKLLVKFYAACVLADISNTDYEGEIKDVGDKVIIRQVPDIVIRDYQKGATWPALLKSSLHHSDSFFPYWAYRATCHCLKVTVETSHPQSIRRGRL